MLSPGIIEGGLHSDSRGDVQHFNSFRFGGVDRFYTISPSAVREVRGWVGHRRDWKWFFAARGRFAVGAVKPDRWEEPSRELPVLGFDLRADRPQILEIPPGWATACMALEEKSMLMVFSSGRIETAKEDDFRFPRDQWIIPA